MFQVEYGVVIWLIVWAYIGSTLGFVTIRYNPAWTRRQKLMEYLKSISVGIFFSIPLYFILQEVKGLSQHLSMTLAGSSAFAITDLIIKLWPKITDGLGNAINKLLDRLINNIGKSNNNEQDT